jgi:hypothetical protein
MHIGVVHYDFGELFIFVQKNLCFDTGAVGVAQWQWPDKAIK